MKDLLKSQNVPTKIQHEMQSAIKRVIETVEIQAEATQDTDDINLYYSLVNRVNEMSIRRVSKSSLKAKTDSDDTNADDLSNPADAPSANGENLDATVRMLKTSHPFSSDNFSNTTFVAVEGGDVAEPFNNNSVFE